MRHTQNSAPPARSLLVSDFDGTMTREDFYQLTIKNLLPADVPDYWVDYRAGRITHFQALQAYFAAIRADESTVRAIVERMQLDPKIATGVRNLDRAGWDVVITSAGCAWYIRILLAEAGVDVPVFANPGRFEEGRGLLMEPPAPGPFFSPTLGVDKAAVVRQGLLDHRRVAFAGDGFPDLDAARLVPESLRFARADLAQALTGEGLRFQPFTCWSEIARALCDLDRTESARAGARESSS
ncbi:MAG: HAD-IB family phosphatase [Paludisphaera borealis]|uniref:HAD-IB family phosphatase n=1 Tax=Paludisphaera borealis TaxID=1387353 RepID=UPI00283F94D9|nr:HAD-IB family phosphatase [Paludisphaera borealis]MDR3618010.1 HAD-IB family phosphatase [Paludisphaera borealis]